jgi:mannose-1-phosphate guanylyltransferase
VILCGGAGSRLWPVSRELHPKPFIRLNDNQSLLQKAFLRAASLEGVNEIITVTNRDLFFKTEEELCKVNSAHLNTSFILEPVGRNTSAAIAAALLHIIKAYGKNTVILVLAADHLIDNQEAFASAVAEATALAQQEKLVTFGIRPHAPETGYGYIEAEGNRVLRFVEKPSIEKAREYFDSGRFLWNSGMFCFKAEAMQQAMMQYCRDIFEATENCMSKSHVFAEKRSKRIELDIDSFKQIRDTSIDYAVMERAQNISVVPCSIGWSDIGSWDTLGELRQADAHGNRVDGEALLRDVSNSYIQSDKRVVGAVGVDNLIIVDTPDALLVADKRCAQDVKHLYAELKAKGHDTHKQHLTVYRPWGTYM